MDENLQDTEDLRFNWQNALAVSMNQRMALKFGVGLVFDNQPQLVDVPLFNINGIELGNVPARAVNIAVTASVVINFRPGQLRSSAVAGRVFLGPARPRRASCLPATPLRIT